MSLLSELGYLAVHIWRAFTSWCYHLFVLVQYRFFYWLLSPAAKAYLDHEYKIVSPNSVSLWFRFWRVYALSPLLTHHDGSFRWTISPKHPKRDEDGARILNNFGRSRAQRTDTPSAAFLRIVYYVFALPNDPRLNVALDYQIQDFWQRGIQGASKPDHFLFGGSWRIADLPAPQLPDNPLLWAIAASTAEQMAEAYNRRIGMEIRRDLQALRARRPRWDKNLAPCALEQPPDWCKTVGPVPVQTVVDRQAKLGTAKGMLESKAEELSPSFRKRNLLASSQFMYFV